MSDHTRFARVRTLNHPGFKPAVLALAVASAFALQPGSSHAQPLPAGGVAVHGQASISNPAPNQLRVVTQNGAGTNHSAINWQSFSIAAGNSTTVVQPGASSLSINRVVTNTPSNLFGTLSSNGRLVLVNQSGIAVAAGAVIDTAGFTASTLRMSDADALAGRLRFGDATSSMGGAAGITVHGRITARDGDVVLVAPNIELGGSALLQATNGSTILAAGQQVEITGRGLEGITLLVQAPTDQVRNLGRLEGDAVGIFAGTLRHSGEIQATTASLEGGAVVLKASGDAYVEGAAKVMATGSAGGRVDVLGQRVAIADQALIDVSGTHGGGTIRIGGDTQGKNPELPNAQMTYVGVDTVLKADALQNGDGGRVIVWADDATRAHGTIAANGAGDGGGGFVETSGRGHLEVGGIRVSASGSAARPGTWLLDPADITITHGAATGPYPSGNKDELTIALGPGSLANFFPVASAGASTLTDGDLNSFLNGGSNLQVVVQTANTPSGTGSGDITFDGSSAGAIVISRTNNTNTNPNSLTFNADRNIVFSSGSTTFRRSGASTAKLLTVELNPGGTVSGKVQTSAGASVVLDGVNDELILVVKNGKVWDNAGTLTLNGLSLVSLPNQTTYATLNNLSTGVVNINSASNWSFLSDPTTQGGIVNNAGTLNVSGTSTGGGNATSWEALVSNLPGGTLNVAAGKLLSVQNGGTLSGSVFIDAGGQLQLAEQHAGPVALTNTAFSGAGRLGVGSAVTANFNTTSGTLGQLDVGGSANVQSGSLTVQSYTQTTPGSSMVGAGTLQVTSGFNHSAGSFAPTGTVSISQASGNLNFADALTATSVSLSSSAGNLNLSAPIATSGPIALSGATGMTIASNLTTGTTLSLTTTGGSITQSAGAITATGATTVNAGTFNVSLAQAGNNFSSIGVTAGAATLVDVNALVLDASTTTSSLTVTAGGPVTQTGALNIAGVATINAGANNVTLTNAGNDFSVIGVTGAAVAVLDANALQLAATNASGTLSVTTNGALTQSAPVVAAGASTLVAGAGDILLGSVSNDFSGVSLTGGHITLVDANALTITSRTQSANKNLFLQAGGTLTLPAASIDTGVGQLSLISGATLLTPSAASFLNGSDLLLSGATGVNLRGDVTASGTLLINAPAGTGVVQFGGTTVRATGATTVNTGTGPVSLNANNNDFSSISVTGGTVSVRDINALQLGAMNVSNGLTLVVGDTLTQTAPVLVTGGTTDIFALGATTLTTPGNRFNSLTINAPGIDVVDANSLAVTSLITSGLATRLVAGGTLTLPGTAINAGASDLTLSSLGGSLTLPAALNGRNINLNAVTGLTVNAPVSASGSINANVTGGASTTTVTADVNAGGSMTLNLAGGLEMPAANQTVRLGAGSGQAINAKYIALAVSGSGTSEIFNASGAQTITTSGKNGNGEGILVVNNGTGANTANITNAAGLQTITVNDADVVRIQGVGGQALIKSNGDQTIVVQGAASGNALQLGTVAAVSQSEISGNNQSVTVGQAGQSGSILVLAGVADTRDSGFNNNGGTQTIKTVGTLTLQGGSAIAAGGVDCPGVGGACAYIGQDGAGLQMVAANVINLFGGSAGSHNLGVIGAVNAGASQLIQITGGGSLNLLAGTGSGSSNKAAIFANGNSQIVDFVIGGSLNLTGGSVGTSHAAGIFAKSASGAQTISGAPTINMAAGASGGGSGVGNSARIDSAGSQMVTAGGGGIHISGGGGTGLQTDNDAQIFQSGLAGTTQSVTVSGGGAITLVGGSSSLTNVGGTGHGSKAKIEADGDSQSIVFTAGGAINLTGGTNGSRAFAVISSANGSQTISGAPDITMVGGASGGFNGEGNRTAISADLGVQTITAGNILIRGGALGIENRSTIYGDRAQTITATGLTMIGGANGGGVSDGNRAYVGTGTNATQVINLGSGGLHMMGGSGTLTDNAAQIEQLGNGAQTININNGGIVMVGGSSAGQNVGGTGHGSRASIYSEGASQTINFTGSDRSITMTGGTVGSRNFAQIFAENTGDQIINGASSITLTGGATGGVAGEGNAAYISTNSGSQTIAANAITMAGGAGGIENGAALQQSSSTGATTGTQSITVMGGGGVSLQGGIGVTNVARIRAYGATQTLNYTAGGSLALTGGTGASLNFARVEAVNGNQNVLGSPTVTLTGGASGGLDLNGNYAGIQANGAASVQTIVANATTLNAGAGGTNNFAVITAPTQDLTVHGSLAINGGGSAASADGTQGGGARIGAGGATTATNVTLHVDNNVTLTGGSVSGAAIGSGIAGGTATDITLIAGGNVTLNSGSIATAGTRIGSPATAPGAGTIAVTATGAIALGGASAGETSIRTLGNVALNAASITLGNTVTGGTVLAHGTGGVTLAGVGSVSTSAAGDALKLAVDSGSFGASAGAGALTASGGGRWLVFSNNPALDSRGGLAYNFKQYGKVFGDANPVLGSGNGFLYSVTPTATAALVGAVSKTYDGGTAAPLTGANYSSAGIDGDVVVLNNPVAGTYDTKNVGTGKVVTAGGLSVVSASNGAASVFGYNSVVAPATGAVGQIVAAPVTVSYSPVTKPFDGTPSAPVTASATGLVAGDAIAVTQSGAFVDKNAGSGKPVNVNGIALTGADAGNYVLASPTTASTTGNITALASLAWTGSAGDSLWSNASNWAGNVVPDGNNVSVVSIPAGAGSVIFSNAMPATSLQSLTSARPVSVISGNLQVTSAMVTDSYSQSGGSVSNAGTMTVANSFSLTAGTLANTGNLNVGSNFSQTGGTISGTGSLAVGGVFAQSAGSIVQGSISIAQPSGNLSFSNLQASSVSLAAPAGTIGQSGPLVASTLLTTSLSGTSLTNASNHIGSLFAQNTGSGNIAISNNGVLLVLGLDNAGGSIGLINTGGVTTIGAVTATGPMSDVSLTANSPLTISAPVSAGRDVLLSAGNPTGNLTLTDAGTVSAGNTLTMFAGSTLSQNSAVLGQNGVTADGGLPMVFGPLATANNAPVLYRVNGVAVAPPPTVVTPPPTELLRGTPAAQTDVLVTFLDLFEAAVEKQNNREPTGTNPDGSKKKKSTGDMIVTEGEICR